MIMLRGDDVADVQYDNENQLRCYDNDNINDYNIFVNTTFKEVAVMYISSN